MRPLLHNYSVTRRSHRYGYAHSSCLVLAQNDLALTVKYLQFDPLDEFLLELKIYLKVLLFAWVGHYWHE